MKNILIKTILLIIFISSVSNLFSQVPPPPPPPPAIENEEVFIIVEDPPRFPGCEDIQDKSEQTACSQKKMLEYIYKNLQYPAEAKDKGIEGQVVIQFVVDKDGAIENINLIRDVDGGCGKAAFEVVKSMNNMPQKWIPGKQRGRAVKVKYTLPVKFKLQDNSQNEPTEVQQKQEKLPENYNSPTPSEKLPHVAEEMPRFPGCESIQNHEERKECSNQEMLKFIYSNLSYPAEARMNGYEGTVILMFTVQKDGSLADFKIIREVAGGCSEAALKVIKQMNDMPEKWIPAKQDGEAIDLNYTLPVKFKLEDGKTKRKRKN